MRIQVLSDAHFRIADLHFQHFVFQLLVHHDLELLSLRRHADIKYVVDVKIGPQHTEPSLEKLASRRHPI